MINAHDAVACARGFLGTPYLLFALSDTGHADAAYRMLLNEDCPGWLYAVDRGATTIWERWDALLPDGTVSSDPPEEDFPVSTLLYDYSAVESPEELKRSARSALLSHAGRNTMEISMTDRVGLELTDTAAVRDTLTGMTALLRVTGQELTINSSGLTLTHHLE